jgi:hypothetical protein
MQGTLGGMVLVYMYTATDQGFGMGGVSYRSLRTYFECGIILVTFTPQRTGSLKSGKAVAHDDLVTFTPQRTGSLKLTLSGGVYLGLRLHPNVQGP